MVVYHYCDGEEADEVDRLERSRGYSVFRIYIGTIGCNRVLLPPVR